MDSLILLPHARKNFTEQTTEHDMYVLRNDSPYRHLRFAKEDTISYWFEIVTFPNVLIFNGDYGCYVFSRITDMFEFFRNQAPHPEYWSSKLIGQQQVTTFSGSHVREYLAREFREYLRANERHWSPDECQNYIDEFEDEIINNCHEENDFNNIGFKELESGFVFDPAVFNPKIFTMQFLWACFAIPWAIKKYDNYRQL